MTRSSANPMHPRSIARSVLVSLALGLAVSGCKGSLHFGAAIGQSAAAELAQSSAHDGDAAQLSQDVATQLGPS